MNGCVYVCECVCKRMCVCVSVCKRMYVFTIDHLTLLSTRHLPSITSFTIYNYYSAFIPVNQVMENSRSIESLDGYQKKKVTKKPLFQRLLERAQADEERAMRKKVCLFL